MVNHLVQHIVLSVLRHQLQHVDVLTVVINAMGLQHLCIKVYLLKIYLNQNVMILVGGSDNNDYLFLTARNLKIMISDLPVGTHLRVRTSNNNNHSIVLAGKTDTTIPVDISHILGNLITVIFDYQILRKPLKILSL